ncbi:hypothetical protein WHR41_09550 [Cladosporium halotolerans]|uniref:Uncharacterized protein n=1 Tax=Cladosporium halotolerans TaxID=1052096 RepID=A0AB34K9F4_9PEZI
MLHLHNQSVNVYSHLVGASDFAFYSFHVIWGRDLDQAHGRSEGRIALLLYCWSVAICFACSAAFHLLSNHSPSVSSLCNRLDYLGIIVLMWGAMVSTVHFGFVCSKELRILYWTLISLSALCCGRTILGTDFASARLRKRRTIFYAAFGSLSLLFTSHGVVTYGWRLQYVRMSLSWMCWTAVANTCGAIIYAMRLPERKWPRRFDVWGSSHQIFHLLVLLAAWLHLQGLTQALAAVSDMGGLCLSRKPCSGLLRE